jgi:hypothetical protein
MSTVPVSVLNEQTKRRRFVLRARRGQDLGCSQRLAFHRELARADSAGDLITSWAIRRASMGEIEHLPGDLRAGA